MLSVLRCGPLCLWIKRHCRMEVLVRKILENTKVEMCCVLQYVLYEIWSNIAMIIEPAYGIESNCHLSVIIHYAETCMWRVVINQWHLALFLASLYKYVNVVACKSFKLLSAEARSVWIVRRTLYYAFVLIFCFVVRTESFSCACLYLRILVLGFVCIKTN